MTPEMIRLAVRRQSPEQRKAMLFALRISELVIDRFVEGKADLAQIQEVEDWLLGRYVMISSSSGYVLIPRRSAEPQRMNGIAPPQPTLGKVDRDPKPGPQKVAADRVVASPDRPKPSPPAKPLMSAFRKSHE